jgi:hypothetical protein
VVEKNDVGEAFVVLINDLVFSFDIFEFFGLVEIEVVLDVDVLLLLGVDVVVVFVLDVLLV